VGLERRAEAVAAVDEVATPSCALVGGLPDAVRDRDALSDGAQRWRFCPYSLHQIFFRNCVAVYTQPYFVLPHGRLLSLNLARDVRDDFSKRPLTRSP
jgi:hypothetical protein